MIVKPCLYLHRRSLVYDMKGEVYALPADIGWAFDDLTVPDGYSRDGSRERSLMYSLGAVSYTHLTLPTILRV